MPAIPYIISSKYCVPPSNLNVTQCELHKNKRTEARQSLANFAPLSLAQTRSAATNWLQIMAAAAVYSDEKERSKG